MRSALIAIVLLTGCAVQPTPPTSRDASRPPAAKVPPTDRELSSALESGARGSSDASLVPGFKVLYAVKPRMSAEAIRQNIQGLVTVEIHFASSGEVKRIRVVKSAHELLTAAVLSAVQQWKISPFVDESGKSKEVIATQTFGFKVE